jgi:Leucine-rich repeat (LRR) protein
MLLVGLPVYALHWWLAQRAVRRGADQRAASLRKAYFYGVQAVTTFFALDSLRNLLSGLFAASTIPNDLVVQGAVLLASATFWAYHAWLAANDAAVEPEMGGGATLRRWYLFGLAAAGLFLLTSGIRDLAVQLVTPATDSSRAFSSIRLVADAVAQVLTGLAGWLPVWLLVQSRVRSQADEQRSLLRKVYLYGAVFAGAAIALFSLAAWLQMLITIAFGDPVPPAAVLARDMTDALVTALLGALVWAFHARVLAADARLPSEAPRQTSIRRLYDYLVAVISLTAWVVGVALALQTYITIVMNWYPLNNTDVRFWHGQLAWGVAMMVVGLPVWLRAWRRVQSVATAFGTMGQAERNATLRRVFLFGTALVSALVVLVNLANAAYQGLALMLGESADNDIPFRITMSLSWALVVSVPWLYHLRAIQRDGANSMQARHPVGGRLAPVRFEANAIAWQNPDSPNILAELAGVLTSAGALAADRSLPILCAALDARNERSPDNIACYVENGMVVALALRGCGLSSLPDSIGQMTGLRQLDLTGNRLTLLPESLGNLVYLERLYVDDNQLTALPDSIGNLHHLEELFVDRNRLGALPESIGLLAGLCVLNAYSNLLTDLPPQIGALSALQDISVGHNQLATVPDGFWRLTNLEVLNLAENRFTVIPEAIGALSQLHTLDLGHNALTQLPDALGQLTSLTHFLYVSDNQLTNLPESLARLTRLRYFNATDNRLTALPEWFGQLAGLRELRLYNNQLTALPESIGRLSVLRELHLMNNRLETLPDSIGSLSELREIHLMNNRVANLPTSIGRLPNLTRLDLRNNRLRAFPETTGGLARLTFLDLRNNKLIALPESLAALPRLEKLDLRWNKLASRPKWIDALTEKGCDVFV